MAGGATIEGKENGEAEAKPSTQTSSLDRWSLYNAHRRVHCDVGKNQTELLFVLFYVK